LKWKSSQGCGKSEVEGQEGDEVVEVVEVWSRY
jgi:hypothetical protein